MELHFPHPEAGTYVIGATRFGKSSFLAHRMLADEDAGYGFVLIDPKGNDRKGSLADLIYGHVGSCTVLDVESANFGVNLFSGGDDVDATLGRVMGIFSKVFGLSRETTPRLRNYLRYTALLLILTGGTMADMPEVLTDPRYRAEFLKKTTNRKVHRFWASHEGLSKTEKEQRIESTSLRVDELLGSERASRIFGARENTVEWDEIMEGGETVLVRLAAGDLADLSDLVGSVVLTQIAAAGLGRSSREPFGIYCDEYHRFVTPAINDLLTFGGGFGLCTTVAHQHRSQLDRQTQGATLQCGNLVVFRVNGEDANELVGEFAAPEEEPRIIGRMAIQSVSQDPISDLLRGRHSDPGVQRLVSHRFRPLMDELKIAAEVEIGVEQAQPQRYRSGTTTAGVHADEMALRRMTNSLLVEAMDGKIATEYELEYRVIQVVLAMAPKLEWELRHFSSAPIQVVGRLELAMATYLPGKKEVESWEYFAAYERQLLGSIDFSNQDRRPHDVVVEEKVQHLIKRLKDTASTLWDLAVMVRRQPMMVDTAQSTPMYERPRSYDDRLKGVANQLPNLERGVARVKIWQGIGFYQGEVELPPPPPYRGGFVGQAFSSLPEPEEAVYYEEDEEPPSAMEA